MRERRSEGQCSRVLPLLLAGGFESAAAYALQQRRELVKVELAGAVGVCLIVQPAQPLTAAHLDAEAAHDPPDLFLVDRARAVLVELRRALAR